MSRALDYANWVLNPANEKSTGRLIKLAAKRFLSDLERTDIYFDEKEANKFIAFAEGSCCLWEDKWRGEPVIITPWRAFIYQQIYGWHYTKTRLRRVKKVYIQVAKKNAKSTDCATVANFHVFSDTRINTPKVFVGANNEEQAKICVNIAGKMVEQSPDLYEYVEDGTVQLSHYNENITRVIHNDRDGFIKPMSKETESKTSKMAGGKHGFNPSLVLIDEFGMADSSAQLDALESAQAARQEPLELVITTAGYKPNGPCYSQWRRIGIQVLEGVSIDDSYLVFIYEIDKPIGPDGKPLAITIKYLTDHPEIWVQANPNIGVSVNPDFLRTRLIAASLEGGAKEVDVKTLNFNEWCETAEVWVSRETWNQNAHGVELEELTGKECFGSIHITSQKELGVFVLLFPNIRENIHVILPIFWMPEKCVIDNSYKTDFGRWVDEGFIITCPGNAIDNYFIFDRVFEAIQNYQLHSISFPVNMEKHDIVQGLILNEIECNPISQGYRGNSEPTFAWEALLNASQVEHFNNPVLAWTNSNCMVLRKGDDIRVERAGPRTAGIVACINALAQWKTVEAEGRNEVGMTMINL